MTKCVLVFGRVHHVRTRPGADTSSGGEAISWARLCTECGRVAREFKSNAAIAQYRAFTGEVPHSNPITARWFL